MPIYIVRPKSLFVSEFLAIASRKLDATSREKQINEVLKLRMDDPWYQGIRKWIADLDPGCGVKHLSGGERHTAVIGTTVLDMGDEEAEQLTRDMPDVMVLRDRPIELIRPTQTVTEAKARVTVGDLWHLKDIGLRAARKKGYGGNGDGVTVAVLDTGIDPTHPELNGKVAGAYTFDVANWEAREEASSEDTDGHGTHVAGLICGSRVGVAPGAEVLNGLMLPKGRGNLSDFILALEWAATQPEVQIVNMSAGIPGYLPEMQVAVADLLATGVLPAFATGNEGRNRTRSPGNYREALSIGASTDKKKIASFSSGGTLVADNHQYHVPDLVAPGQGVYSSVVGGGYEAWDGTSMATPIVSGVAALVLEKYPEITVSDLREELLSTCRGLGQPPDRQGSGLVQVKAAV